MITKNFKALLKQMLQYGQSGASCLLEATDTTNATYYLATSMSTGQYPYAANLTPRFASNYGSAGIYFGIDNSPASETDYKLGNAISSGISSNTPNATTGVDASGNPYYELVYLLTNTTALDITIKEVGYVQNLYCSATQGSTSFTSRQFLLDRTVLSTPVVVPANGTVALKYTLKTIIS